MNTSPTGGVQGPFHEELRRAIARRGLTLERLQHHLARDGVAVGRSTLSVWQSGRRTPTGPDSLLAVAGLERVLGLEPGHLSSRLADPSAGTPPDPMPLSGGDVDAGVQMLAQVGCDDVVDRFAIRSGTTRITVGHTGAAELIEFDLLVRARRSASRFGFLYTPDSPEVSPDDLSPRAVAGGRLGRIARDHGELGLYGIATEIVLNRPVRRGEIFGLRHQIASTSPVQMTQFTKYSSQQQVFNVLEVTFHPDALPSAIVEFEKREPGAPDLVSRPVQLGADLRAVMIREGGRRHITGLRWTY